MASNCHRDHNTICQFRRNDFEAAAKAFERVLIPARESKLLRVGTVGVDGPKAEANAKKPIVVEVHAASVQSLP